MKKLFVIATSILAALFVISYSLGLFESEENIRYSPLKEVEFTEINTEFEHQVAEGSFPFTGSAVIDVDSNGTMELYVSGSAGQPNALLSYNDNKLVDIAEQAGLQSQTASFGVIAFDVNDDKQTDLIVAKQDGVWLYLNDQGKFVANKLNTPIRKYAFPTSVAISDINNDGLVDIYINYFVELSRFRASTFNDSSHAKKNVMLLNKGQGKFVDITEQTATGGIQNTFLSVFIDLDNNGKQDLVLANNTGPIEIFRNLGNLKFEAIDIQTQLGYWMGIALGDIDNDGDQDLYLSNIGSSIPESLVKGDLNESQDLSLEWVVLENKGNFKFEDITKKIQLDGYGFAWGGVFEDINLDGKQDLLVAQNYINWPGHNINKLPGKVFLQSTENNHAAFLQADSLGLENSYYGQSPIIVDLNNDGRPDVVWLNMNGPLKAFINNSQQDFLKVKVPDTLDYLGATLWLETTTGNSYAKQINAGVGMGTDQTPNVFFGLAKNSEIKALHIRYANNREQVISNVGVNSTVTLP